jgi:hypothetical protein
MLGYIINEPTINIPTEINKYIIVSLEKSFLIFGR